jgi:hypothetical protein
MRDLLNQLQRVGNDLANLNYQLQLDREALALREATISLAILDARNETGKPLYSNETARAAALTIRLNEDADYRIQQAAVRNAERERGHLQAMLEQLRGLCKLELLERQEAMVSSTNAELKASL